MFYVYVLRSKRDHQLYTGFTTDLKERFRKHNKGEVVVTKYRRPFYLVYYEAFKNKKDAIIGEKFYKTGYGREILSQKIKFSLEQVSQKEFGAAASSAACRKGRG
jgi:putative endonuclease